MSDRQQGTWMERAKPTSRRLKERRSNGLLLATAGSAAALVAMLAAPGARAASPDAAIAPASPVCTPRTTPVSSAPATEVKSATVAGTGGLVERVVLHSPAMGDDQDVDVLLPAGYDPSSARRYPVLYLLHGAGGAYSDWVDHGVEQLIATDAASEHLGPFITVMPDGGAWGFYSDWYGSDLDGSTATPPPAWTTYHIDELIPWVDAHFDTLADRQHRAIAGLSMGGFGTMSYAARYPDLFAAAGSFSGAVDTDIDYPAGGLGLNAASAAFTDSLPEQCVWGDPVTQGVRWHGSDPTYLASNLAHTSLFVAFGDGSEGPYDRPSTPSATLGTAGDGGIEAAIDMMNEGFVSALQSAGVRFTEYAYGAGTHSWPYWLRDLTRFLPQMSAVFSSSGPSVVPGPFSFRSSQSVFSIGGWRFTADRSVPEFTYLSDVRPTGLVASGSGTLDVDSPADYVAGRRYRIRKCSGPAGEWW